MTRLLLVLSLVVGVLVAAPAALACSCAIGDPRDMLERSDGAFVGTLVAREEVGDDQALHTFQVEEALKGEIGATVVVRSHRDGATCGLEVPIGGRVGLVVDREGDEWLSNLCQQVDADELLAAAAPLPTPTGSGPVAFVVGGSFGEHRTIALDARGRTLAYGRGDGEVYLLGVCPGGDRVVELVGLPWETGGGYAIEVRDLATMEVVARLGGDVRWGTSSPDALACEQPDGLSAVVLARSEVAKDRLLRLTEDDSELLWRGYSDAASFAGGKAYLCAGKQGRRAVEVALATGTVRLLGRLPAYTGRLAPSPNGRYLAGVAYSSPNSEHSPPSRAVLVDTRPSPAALRTAPLGSANVSGDMFWLSPRRVLFVPLRGDGDRIRLYDTALRAVDRGELFWGYDATVAGDRLVTLTPPFLAEASPPTGALTELARLPSPVAFALEAVVDGPQIAGPTPAAREPVQAVNDGADGGAPVAGIAGAGAGAALLAAFAIRRRPRR